MRVVRGRDVETNTPATPREPRLSLGGMKTPAPVESGDGEILAGNLRRSADLEGGLAEGPPVMVSQSPPGIFGPDGSGSLW